ncbi:MAG: hypothetical protein ACXW04_01250 [Methylobacter sp.]
MAIEQYQPKGGMCGNCVNSARDCSHLNFKKMNVIEKYSFFEKTVFIVICTDFERNPMKTNA